MVLNTPLSINHLILNNRIVMPPMATHGSENGYITDVQIEYYKKRVNGGNTGLIITEHCYVAIQGKADAKQLQVEDDDCISYFGKLTDTIHTAGSSKVFCQINHAGSMTSSKITGVSVVGPSAVMNPAAKNPEIPHELSIREIQDIERDFCSAARRAKEAGYDGVVIHAAHGYLLNEFYSPLTNKRSDEYGVQSLENRLRIHIETIQKVRQIVGNEFPISIRFGGCDYMDGGSTIEDAADSAVLLQNAGADMIDISGGMCQFMRKGHTEPGYFQDMSEKVKGRVCIPVLLTGGVTEPNQAEELLESGKCDIIGIGRAMMKNADWSAQIGD